MQALTSLNLICDYCTSCFRKRFVTHHVSIILATLIILRAGSNSVGLAATIEIDTDFKVELIDNRLSKSDAQRIYTYARDYLYTERSDYKRSNKAFRVVLEHYGKELTTGCLFHIAKCKFWMSPKDKSYIDDLNKILYQYPSSKFLTSGQITRTFKLMLDQLPFPTMLDHYYYGRRLLMGGRYEIARRFEEYKATTINLDQVDIRPSNRVGCTELEMCYYARDQTLLNKYRGKIGKITKCEVRVYCGRIRKGGRAGDVVVSHLLSSTALAELLKLPGLDRSRLCDYFHQCLISNETEVIARCRGENFEDYRWEFSKTAYSVGEILHFLEYDLGKALKVEEENRERKKPKF